MTVFEQPPDEVEHLEDILDELKHAFTFGIITAGETWVQERRLASFRLRQAFSAVEIVETKTAEVFDQFINKYDVDRPNSYVVGDSIRSDIIPARAANLNVILVSSKNWSEFEQVGNISPLDIPIITTLKDLPRVIGRGPSEAKRSRQ